MIDQAITVVYKWSQIIASNSEFDNKQQFNKYTTYLDWRISPHADCDHHSCKRYFVAVY